MSRVVYKYLISPSGKVHTPRGSRILKVNEQKGYVYVWMEIDKNIFAGECHVFKIFATGKPMDDDRGEYVGTVFIRDATLVYHVYHRLVA